MYVNNFQIPDSKKRWENSDVKVLSHDKKVDDVYYEIEVNCLFCTHSIWIHFCFPVNQSDYEGNNICV